VKQRSEEYSYTSRTGTLQSMEACISSAPFLFLQNESENCGGKRRQAGKQASSRRLWKSFVILLRYKAAEKDVTNMTSYGLR
jgi:aspartyl/asparaginyl beta-hydroxylase (cupin superfamily)